MAICKAASAIVILLLAGCARPQVACGPALPPIAAAPSASLAAAPSTSLAAPPGFTQPPAAVPQRPPVPVVVQAPPPNPLDNVAAMGGR
jgi:hypothetical protein